MQLGRLKLATFDKSTIASVELQFGRTFAVMHAHRGGSSVYFHYRAVQPVVTCRQSPYLHKPATVIVTSFTTELATPTLTYVTDTLPRLI